MTEQLNLAVKISSDPAMQKKIFSRLKEPQFTIPNNCEEFLNKINDIKSTEKGTLISKVTSPDDYQTQIHLMSRVQHLLDQVQELSTRLYFIQQHWNDLLKAAKRIITLTYFDELNALKDGVRKQILEVALQPVQDGVDRLQCFIERAESSYSHLNGKIWNIKKGAEITKEFLTLLKYGNTPREL